MPTQKKDFYEVLGVEKSATQDEIKKAYRRLAREKHPDVNAHRRDEAEAEFKEIGQAYAVLSDEDKRARFDQFGAEGMNGGGFDVSGAGGLGDLFEVFFNGMGAQGGMGGRAREQIRRGSDLRMDVRLSMEEVWSGATRDLDIPTLLRCDNCGGNGAQPGTDVTSCSGCNGTGRLREVKQTFFGNFVQEAPCVRCGGRGKIPQTPCTNCNGQGRKRGTRKVSVNIPGGVDDGDRVCVMGAGEDGEAGAPAGDLYCFVSVSPHDKFERYEQHVAYAMNISFAQAALGDTVDVPTLELGDDGAPVMAEVVVPAGTQPGAQFKIRDKGFPIRGSYRGDQICVAQIVIPKKLNERQKELLREFAELEGEDPEEQPRGFFDKIKDVFQG